MVYNGFKWSSMQSTTNVTSTTGATNETVSSGYAPSYYANEYYTTNVGNQIELRSRVKKIVAKREFCELCGGFEYLHKHTIEEESIKVCSFCLDDITLKKEKKKSLLQRIVLWLKNLFR